jgi:integrase/recombinase XerD
VRPAQIGFPQLVQDFFLRRLIAQRGASARTVEAYRDAFELLLGFAQQRTGKSPASLGAWVSSGNARPESRCPPRG